MNFWMLLASQQIRHQGATSCILIWFIANEVMCVVMISTFSAESRASPQRVLKHPINLEIQHPFSHGTIVFIVCNLRTPGLAVNLINLCQFTNVLFLLILRRDE